jgi:S1-C subfamily serine protease
MNLNSSAVKAGLLKDDILLQINDADLNTTSDFYEQINKYRPGDRIRIKFHRRGETREISILLTNYLNTTEYITVRNDKLLKDLGIEIRDLHTGEKARIKAQGVIVISVSKGSIIDQTNMEPGFIIEKINNIEVSNATEFISLLKNMSDKVILEGFYERYAGQFPYSFDLPPKK